MSIDEKGIDLTPLLEESTLSDSIEPSPKYSYFAVLAIFFYPALGGFLFGYDIGGISAITEQLQSFETSGVSWGSSVRDSSLLLGAITSSSILGAIIGSILCFRLEKKVGRRRELLLSSLLYIAGTVIRWVSGIKSLTGGFAITILICGSIIYGMGIGFTMHGAPAYIGEMSPSPIRGLLIGMKEVFIVTGILIGYIMGYLLRNIVGGWRYLVIFAIFPAFIMFIGMWYLPPSARWLALHGKLDEARSSLSYVYAQIPNTVIRDIEVSVDKSTVAGKIKFSALFKSSCKPAMIAGLGLVTLQQITGQPSVLYYANTIFSDAGLSSMSSVFIGMFKVLATLCAVFTVDKYGRKKLLLIGCSFMLTALLFLGVLFLYKYVNNEDCNEFTDEISCLNFSQKCTFKSSCQCDLSENDVCRCCISTGIDFQKGLILAAMFLYIGGYQIGFGPLGWIILSEIFPLELRGKAISIAVVANFASNLFVTFLFPVELDYIGAGPTFFIFAAIDLFAIYFIVTKVPETKGRTLEEIERMFQRISEELLIGKIK